MASAGIARLRLFWGRLAGGIARPTGHEESGKGNTEEEDERCEDRLHEGTESAGGVFEGEGMRRSSSRVVI